MLMYYETIEIHYYRDNDIKGTYFFFAKKSSFHGLLTKQQNRRLYDCKLAEKGQKRWAKTTQEPLDRLLGHVAILFNEEIWAKHLRYDTILARQPTGVQKAFSSYTVQWILFFKIFRLELEIEASRPSKSFDRGFKFRGCLRVFEVKCEPLSIHLAASWSIKYLISYQIGQTRFLRTYRLLIGLLILCVTVPSKTGFTARCTVAAPLQAALDQWPPPKRFLFAFYVTI